MIVTKPFSDEWEISDRCDMKNRLFLNTDAGDAICEGEPDIWIAQRLAEELRVSGFPCWRELPTARVRFA